MKKLLRNLALVIVLLLIVASVYMTAIGRAPTDHTISLQGIEVDNHQQKEALSILLFGDQGNVGENQKRVGEAMYQSCKQTPCDFALVLGDNFYSHGVTDIDDPLFELAFEVPYKSFSEQGRIDFWTVIGNHDWDGSEQAQIDYTARSKLWRMPAHDYTVPYLPGWIHLYGMDTNMIYKSSSWPLTQQLVEKTWQQQLITARQALCGKPGWRILFAHQPIYSTGKEGNREREHNLEEALLGLIKECDIDLLISGHEHYLEHIQSPDFDGVISGSASQVRERSKSIDRPGVSSAFKATELGYARLAIDPKVARVEYFDAKNQLLYSFALNKKN